MRIQFLLSLAAAAATIGSPVNAGPVVDLRNDAEQTVLQSRRLMLNSPARAYQMGIDLSRRVMRSGVTRNRDLALARAYWVSGEAAARLERRSHARMLLDRSYALAVRSGDIKARGDVLVSRGGLAQDHGEVATALSDYLEAMSIFQKLDDHRSQAITLQNLGGLYLDAFDYDRAERYFLDAGEAETTDPGLSLSLSNNIANLMSLQGRSAEAVISYRRAAEMARKMRLHSVETNILSNIVRSEVRMGNLSQAARTLRRAGAVALKNDLPVSPSMMYAKAYLLVAQKRWMEARAPIESVLTIGEDSSGGSRGEMDAHETAYTIYKHLGNFPAALMHLEKAKAMKEQTTSLATSSRATLLAAKFDFANQELRIAKLKADKLQRDMRESSRNSDRQRTIFIMIAAGMLVVLSAVCLIAAALRRGRNMARKANLDLEAALKEVEQREEAEQLATEKAEHDPLTGLPNRRHMHERLGKGDNAPNLLEERVSMLLLDLDRFKPINDIHGHEIGDAVLVAVADRLRTVLEARQAVAMRLGGDEFLVALTGPHEDADAADVAMQIIDAISAPYEIGERRLTIGTSVGISRSTQDGTSLDDLLRTADIAMYEAKHSGRKTFRFFDEEMVIKLRERADLESDLRTAIESDGITAHFQPIHCLEQDRITGFEALARWTHPVRGAVSPDVFIPIAEDSGLIDQITTTIVRQACRAARDWPDDVSVSVNLSPVLLRDSWIAAKILGIIASEGLAARRLVVEITEHAVIDDLEHAAEVIDGLRASGIRIAMDDFGKGYSSLSHLRQLSFDNLKLDASFVRTLGEDDSLQIATAVAGLGAALKLPVTAEGVETEEHARIIRSLGFTYAQGYHFGRPMPREEARKVAWPVDAEMQLSEVA